MIQFKTMLAVAALGFGTVQTAVAQNNERQETRKYPAWFVGVQGGAQSIMNGYKVGDVITPIGAVQGGAYFSPSLGARIHVNGWKSKEGVKNIGTYKFDYMGANLDMLMNLTNAFSKRDDHVFNVILLGGLGMNKAWGTNYNNLPGYAYQGVTGSKVEVVSNPSNHVAFSERVGVMFDFHVAHNWGINLEVQANHIDGRSYAHEFNGAKNWQMAGFLGVTYTFGKKHKKAAPVVPVEPTPAPAPEPAPAPAPKPVPAPTPKQLAEMNNEIYFVIGQSVAKGQEAAKVSDVAEWMKNHPTATATIKGYADKGTGYPKINAYHARKRAEGVARELTQKYGIEASRLEVSSYGDTVQPFSQNDKNRVVIVVAKEK